MVAQELQERVDDAILIDEVGLEAGRYGPYVLRTLYQPIFHAAPARPWGVAAAVQPYREGLPVSRQTFLADVDAADMPFIDALCSLLQLRNHRNIGADGLTLLFEYDPEVFCSEPAPVTQARLLMDILENAELDPALLVCQLPGGADAARSAELAAALRRHGIRIVVDDFGTDGISASRVRLVDPEIVKLDGGWFRRIADAPTAARLLGSLVHALGLDGRQVLIEGIETPSQLQAALDTGAGLIQGDMLRPAQLAGVLFDTAPLNVKALLDPGGNVIPLFAHRRRWA